MKRIRDIWDRESYGAAWGVGKVHGVPVRPKDLERYWMGHAPEDVGDLYSKLKDDVAYRQEWAERVGLGFELVHTGPQNAESIEAEKVA